MRNTPSTCDDAVFWFLAVRPISALSHLSRVRRTGALTETVAVQDRIQAALDYRRFHRFRVDLIDSSGNHKPFTERTHGAGSGGSKARLIHLALLATIASYYDSVSDQIAPRLGSPRRGVRGLRRLARVRHHGARP